MQFNLIPSCRLNPNEWGVGSENVKETLISCSLFSKIVKVNTSYIYIKAQLFKQRDLNLFFRRACS